MSKTSSAPGSAPENRERLRQGLLDQLAHLVREVDMLERGAIARVPEKLLAEAPPDEPHSIKEIFALIARLDEVVHPRRLERIASEDSPRLAPADPEALLAEEEWNDRPLPDLFERVRTARQGLIETLQATPPEGWLRVGFFPGEEALQQDENTPAKRDLYWMAHALCQRDRARLEHMTRRLYESHMGPAPERGPQNADPGHA